MPGIGLGEITPIKLQFQRENFNALIGRHGQSVRWLMAEKCSCVDQYMNADANCGICKGKGITYTVPTTSIRVESLIAPIDGVIQQGNVISVKDFTGKDYTVTTDDCITYATGVLKGQQYQVKYTEDITKSQTGEALYIADKLYKIDLPITSPFGDIQGSLVAVTASVAGTPLTVSSLFRNCFEITDTISSSDVVDYSCSYVEPFTFVLANSGFTKEDRRFLDDVGGKSILTFPQRWMIYEHDLIVALNATLSKKEVLISTGDIDSLPSFYPVELLSASTIVAGAKVEFTPYTDFIVYKGNQIKWISTEKPDAGSNISISYTYNPTYRVLGDMPDPRTSENNRFPRKAALVLYTDFNTREGI